MGCGCNSNISGMKRRGRKSTAIPYMIFGGAAVGAAGANMIDKVTNKVPQIAANPMLGGVAKVGVGVGIILYGGKSDFVKGLGYGVAAQGGKQIIDSSGVLNSLYGGTPTIEGYSSRHRGAHIMGGGARHRQAHIMGNRNRRAAA